MTGDGSASAIKYLVLLAFAVLVATASLLSYSTTGYTFNRYRGQTGEAVVCVEGEVHPTNQTLTVIAEDLHGVVNPYVTVNGIRHVFNMTISDKAVRQKTWSLVLGCNNITWGAENDEPFKVRIEYLSHWRPTVNYLEMRNLIVGHSTRYFISTEDADRRPIMASRLNITDITKEGNPSADLEFNGSAVRYRLEQPGNYKADMQVFDGYVWSDIYEARFTAHVIQTDEQKKASKLRMIEDDPVADNLGLIPAAIKPDDNPALKTAKRAVNGAYVLFKRVLDYGRSLTESR